MISVVIPTCRRPDLLARCLDRLAPGVQSRPAGQYEVIVTDDGVPTVEAFLAEKYPWAKWVEGPRRGPAANRNNGVRHAQGEWIAFTDDDCIPSEQWLAAFVDGIREGCQVYEGKTTCEAGIHSPLDHAPVNLTGGYLWSCNMLISRGLFVAVKGFDEEFPSPHMEDVDFRERLLASGHRFDFLSDAIVDHPPRRLPSGWQLGKSHTSWYYHWNLRKKKGWATPRLVAAIMRTRLRAIWLHRIGIDSFGAFVSLVMELVSLASTIASGRKNRTQSHTK